MTTVMLRIPGEHGPLAARLLAFDPDLSVPHCEVGAQLLDPLDPRHMPQALRPISEKAVELAADRITALSQRIVAKAGGRIDGE